MELWIWAVMAFAAGIVLLILDIFIPSGGAFAVLSAMSVILSIVLGFMSGVGIGVTLSVTAGVLIPGIIAMAIQFWPQTPLGKLILIQPPEHPDDVLPDEDQDGNLRDLIGRQGRAKCTMLPGGIVEIDHRNYDAISEGMPVELGQLVEVVSVRSMRIVVRPTDAATPANPPGKPHVKSDDLLSQPIESIGLDSTQDPLA